MNVSASDSSAATAPDGSPVELYTLLPPDGEPELIHAALTPGASILELGAGAGRVTHGLVALGHRVVAVDQSAAMLTHVRGAEQVLADIETLDLGRRFDGVVLGSYLVNTTNDAQRAAFLATCRRHVADTGLVLVERHDPEWAASLSEYEGTHLGIRYSVREVRHDSAMFSATMAYAIGGQRFQHRFTARILGDVELLEALTAAGLELRRFLPPGRRWAAAAPMLAGATGG